jgi:hypothetical protein
VTSAAVRFVSGVMVKVGMGGSAFLPDAIAVRRRRSRRAVAGAMIRRLG